jgi:hypothetical protein
MARELVDETFDKENNDAVRLCLFCRLTVLHGIAQNQPKVQSSIREQWEKGPSVTGHIHHSLSLIFVSTTLPVQ